MGIEYDTKTKFCVLQKKVLSFGPNRTVEFQLNSSAEAFELHTQLWHFFEICI